MTPRRSAIWKATLRLLYAVIGARSARTLEVGPGRHRHHVAAHGPWPSKRNGTSVLVGLISVGGRWYVGHPNGEVAWTANLRAARRARLAPERGANVDVVATPLEPGAERDAVIVATSRQQPFPASLVYRAARRHIVSEGRYFRLEPG